VHHTRSICTSLSINYHLLSLSVSGKHGENTGLAGAIADTGHVAYQSAEYAGSRGSPPHTDQELYSFEMRG
jgi:hypothetical protein